METKSVWVLLTVHNRKEKTLNCLKYLFKNEFVGANYSVLVVDDGSSDGTSEAVRNTYPNVQIVKGDGTLFWNRGMRLAWETSVKFNPDYYLWLNDDTVIMNDSLARLLNSSRICNDESIIVGSTFSSEEDQTLSYGGRNKKRNHPLIQPDSKKMLECDVFNGNLVLIPKYVYERVGFNDNYYHHSFGDFDYGIMAGKKGIKCIIAPGYYGYCKRNNPVPIFRRKCYSIIKRYKLLYSPLGHNPFEDYHFNRKFRPFWLCVWYFVKMHINVLFTEEHTKYNSL